MAIIHCGTLTDLKLLTLNTADFSSGIILADDSTTKS